MPSCTAVPKSRLLYLGTGLVCFRRAKVHEAGPGQEPAVADSSAQLLGRPVELAAAAADRTAMQGYPTLMALKDDSIPGLQEDYLAAPQLAARIPAQQGPPPEPPLEAAIYAALQGHASELPQGAVGSAPLQSCRSVPPLVAASNVVLQRQAAELVPQEGALGPAHQTQHAVLLFSPCVHWPTIVSACWQRRLSLRSLKHRFQYRGTILKRSSWPPCPSSGSICQSAAHVDDRVRTGRKTYGYER